jgi:hypothetical protein
VFLILSQQVGVVFAAHHRALSLANPLDCLRSQMDYTGTLLKVEAEAAMSSSFAVVDVCRVSLVFRNRKADARVVYHRQL